jgi:hypothetical protein
MNERTTRLFNAVIGLLPEDQRNAFLRALRQYQESPEPQKQVLRESYRDQISKVATGPLGSSTCPLCGK